MSPLVLAGLRWAAKATGTALVKRWFSKGKEKRAMNGTKAWWQSRAVWGGLVAALAGIGGLFGLNLDEVSQGMIVDVAVQMATVAGALVAVIGRVRATTKIG
ncbi:MAG: hypothetical protein ACE5FN_12275 [Leptospirillia bacterium]